MRRESQGNGAGKGRSRQRQQPVSSGEKSFRGGSDRVGRFAKTSPVGGRSEKDRGSGRKTGGFSGGETRFGKSRPGQPSTFRSSRDTAPKHVEGKAPARRRTLGEERAQSYFRTAEKGNIPSGHEGGKGKRLVLRKEKRSSRSQLLKELGHTTERQSIPHHEEKSDQIRLNRFIANAGVCSRREADTYITAGVVKVNGQTVTELGTKISPDDEVRFDGRLITPERKVYVLLNKPKDVVTTTDDPHAEHTVMDLVKDACEERIYPVGRLDRNTTGLLLLTNDGELSKRLTHPSHKVVKVYQVTLDRTVSVNDIQKVASGIELEDGLIAADAITYVEGQNKDTVGIEIHSGRHRIVRRIFEHLGYRVKALDRVSFAGLTKKNIPRGKWRLLTPREVSYLKMK